MKLCFLADAGSLHIFRWMEYFANTGHEVHIISQRGFRNNINVKNIKLHILKMSKPQIRIVSYPINLLYNAIQIKKLIRHIKPDILHVHYISDLAVLGALTGFHPLVLSAWGSDVLVAPKKSKIMKYHVSYALTKADIVLTIPEFMKEYLMNEFNISKNKIIRIPWGIDLKTFHCDYENETTIMKDKLGIRVDSPVILSNRNMDSKYEIENIIEAIPHTLKQFPNAIFIFIKGYSPSDFEKQMISKAENMNVINSVRFISKVLTSKEMAVYLNMADAFISIPKTDQFASSIMEGMACGAIPIVSNIKAYEQYLENGVNSFVVNSDNPKEIAEKINHCIKNPEIKNEFYQINKNIIEEYEDWDVNSKKMEIFYRDLLK